MPAHRIVVVALLVLGLTACGDPVAPARDITAPVQTDTTSYLLVKDGVGWRTEIRVAWRNASADTLYIVNCRGFTGILLQKQDGSDWHDFWSPAISLCLSGPISIAPGSTFSDTVHIWGAEPGSAMPEFPSKQVEGVFRLVWTEVVYHYTDRGPSFGAAVPIQYRHSNSFRLYQAH